MDIAEKWFRDIMASCYLKKIDEHPDSIFWVYDKNLLRQKKLSKINGNKDIKIDITKGELIFEQDEKNKDFWIKHDEYWSFFETEFGFKYNEIRELTSVVVNDVLKCVQYTTAFTVLTDYLTGGSLPIQVNDVLKCEQYTTINSEVIIPVGVNDALKCEQYTTKKYYNNLTTMGEI